MKLPVPEVFIPQTQAFAVTVAGADQAESHDASGKVPLADWGQGGRKQPCSLPWRPNGEFPASSRVVFSQVCSELWDT